MNQPNDSVSAETREVVDRMLNAITNGDGEAMSACLAPDMHFWMPGETEIHGHFDGRDAFMEISGVVLGQLSEPVALTVKSVIVDGENAVVEAKGASRTNKGQVYENNYCFVWRVEGGVIKDMTEYHDTDLVRRVLLA